MKSTPLLIAATFGAIVGASVYIVHSSLPGTVTSAAHTARTSSKPAKDNSRDGPVIKTDMPRQALNDD